MHEVSKTQVVRRRVFIAGGPESGPRPTRTPRPRFMLALRAAVKREPRNGEWLTISSAFARFRHELDFSTDGRHLEPNLLAAVKLSQLGRLLGEVAAHLRVVQPFEALPCVALGSHQRRKHVAHVLRVEGLVLAL